MKVLDLFSGIGGFSLGLERTGGFETVAFCEIDPFCRRVLAKHWPKVPCYHDVRDLTAARLAADGIAVDVICGGFPCQDISNAGHRAGLSGERSGLWSEYARLIGELRPRYVIVENVSALLGRGIDTVLGDLAEIGFDAFWDCIPASAVGAPHQRDRVWIVAHPVQRRDRGPQSWEQQSSRAKISDRGSAPELADADSPRPQRWISEVLSKRARQWIAGKSSPSMADSAGDGRRQGHENGGGGCGGNGAGPQHRFGGGDRWWRSEPDVGRVANGVSQRVDRLKSLGNAVVPQIPELIGNAILRAAA